MEGIELTEKEKEAQCLIVGEVAKAIKTLEEHFEKYCKDNQNAVVPISYIKASNKIFLDSMSKAI